MFYFRLALALGMTVRELLARVDSAEIAEWRAYSVLEPFGEVIADQRHGVLASVLANVNRDAKKVPQPYTAADFIPWLRGKRKPDGPTLLADAQAQTSLVKRTLFAGVQRKKKR